MAQLQQVVTSNGVKFNCYEHNIATVGDINQELPAYTEDIPIKAIVPLTVEYNGTSYKVAIVANNAFSGCNKIESLTFEDGIRMLGYNVVKNCKNLKYLSIPNCSLFENVVSGCTSLEELNLECTYFNNSSFDLSKSTRLKKVTLKNTLEIGNNALFGITALTEIQLPSTLTSIGPKAFAGSGLKELTIPNSVSRIAYGAFANCKSLTSLTLPFVGETKGKNQFLGYVFGADGYDVSNDYVPTELKSIKVTNQSIVSDHAFQECQNIETVKYTKPIERIGDYAFYNCKELGSITLTNSLDDIGYYAFRKCKSMTSISVPIDTDVDSHAFLTTRTTTIYGKAGSSAEVAANKCSQPFRAYVFNLQLKGSSKILKKGEKYTIKIEKASPGRLSAKYLAWKSSNTKIATVDSKGVVVAKKKGKCVITATAKDKNKKKDSYTILVK